MTLTPAEVQNTLEILTALSQALGRLGLPGLVVLALAGPALVLCAVIIVEYKRGHHSSLIVEGMREESAKLLDTYRIEIRAVIETYRADTQQILRELGGNQAQTDQYYRNNVHLVEQYERLAQNLQDVVISNTRMTERLITIIEEMRKR